MKICKVCELPLALELFHRKNSAKDGRQSVCIACAKILKSTPEKLETVRIRRQTTVKLQKEKGLCVYYKCKKTAINPHNHLCRHHVIEEKIAKALGSRSDKDTIKVLSERLDNVCSCPYTGEVFKEDLSNVQLDHINPRSRFPEQVRDIDNLEWVSTTYNIHKRNMTKEEFINFCHTVYLATLT